MPIHRRELVSAAASLAALAALAPSSALSMTSRLISDANDPLGVRPDFPILENGRTYLNSAYITPCPRSVPAAGAAFLLATSTRPITVGEMLGKANEVRAQFAKLINATSDEIGFVFATSEGENSVANSLPLNPGDNVVVDNLHYDGALVIYRQLGHGALLHVDAIQAMGMIPVDVRADDVDFLCSGTYKWLLGGFGIAPFYIKRSLLDRVPPDRFGVFQIETQTPECHFRLRNTARRSVYATLPFAEVHQLGAALAYLDRVGVPRIRAAFDDAKIDVTVREGHVRVSIALFNTADDVDSALAVTKKLA